MPARFLPIALLAALVLLGACREETVGFEEEAGGTADTADVVAKLSASLEADGFTVQTGKFAFLDVAACEKLFSCFGNNPASPYGLFWLPPAPGQTAAPRTPDSDGHSMVWHLRQDEAVVYVGRTPPAARYFGFTSYLFDRDNPAGGRTTVFGSLGDTLNHLVFATDGVEASNVFDRSAYFVATGHRATHAKVLAAFRTAGVRSNGVNTDPLAPPVMRMGLDPGSDTFSVLFRVAVFADAAEGAAYVQSPPGQVLRVTPRNELAPDPFGMPPIRAKGTGTDENALASAVEALDAAIRARHAPLQAIAPDSVALAPDGYACIEAGTNCVGDNRDALYSFTLPGRLPATDQDFLVVFGVNHVKTGKALYANFSVYWFTKLLGVVSVEDDRFAGSAGVYLPAHPDRDSLYAYKVARDCKGEPYCVRVPVDFPGVPLDAPLAIAWRAYVEPATKTGPAQGETVPSRVIRFAPSFGVRSRLPRRVVRRRRGCAARAG